MRKEWITAVSIPDESRGLDPAKQALEEKNHSSSYISVDGEPSD